MATIYNNIYNKSEAQARAEAMKTLSDDVISDANQIIVQGYAHGVNVATFRRPHDMTDPQWWALTTMIEQKGYKVKNESCQGDGEWVVIEL